MRDLIAERGWNGAENWPELSSYLREQGRDEEEVRRRIKGVRVDGDPKAQTWGSGSPDEVRESWKDVVKVKTDEVPYLFGFRTWDGHEQVLRHPVEFHEIGARRGAEPVELLRIPTENGSDGSWTIVDIVHQDDSAEVELPLV